MPKQSCFAAVLLAVLIATLPGGLPRSLGQDATLQDALQSAGENRGQIELALARVPTAQQTGMAFLLAHMPVRDLQSLSADFLLKHVAIAYESWNQAAWKSQIPTEIFLNDVLPYANVNERRDDVRREFRDRFWPQVKDLESISLAAARLNQLVFKELGVKYSTRRRRADQGPRESMESGLASCTGLSILLIDACRACGIPARFVGTPLWSDSSGNHSWVEIWDDGWHFTGAAEPNGDQLDAAWFVGRAAQAKVGDPRHGIFAVSYQQTDLKFPMVWTRSDEQVFAVDVTARYAKPQKTFPSDVVQLQFRALDAGQIDRCRANLVVKDGEGTVVFRGQTRDESFDANDHLAAQLKPGTYRVELTTEGGVVTETIVADQDGKLITLLAPAGESVCQQLQDFLAVDAAERGDLAEQAFATIPLTKAQCAEATQLLIADHAQRLREDRRQEHEQKRIVLGDLEMPYETKVFGTQPRSLVISMHGGGGAPKAVNDRQWKNQIALYQLPEGIYVAPRAPTDTWNMWHQAHIDQFFTRLIENMILFEGIDPDRVYLTGYSAGGDGVYQLAPRMADQLSAAAMMAGHPNETQPLGLRNLPFTLHVGGEDAAYGRNKIAAEWSEKLVGLRDQDPGGYEHWAKVYAGKGHWMDREEAAGVKWMFQFTRNIIPERIVWLQDDVQHERFYWLAADGSQSAQPRDKIVAFRDGNTLTIESTTTDKLSVLLRDAMLDLDQPVVVKYGKQTVFDGKVDRTIENLARTLNDRGDPKAMFSGRVSVMTGTVD